MTLEKIWKSTRKNKFGALRCVVDGHVFDSKMEMDYYSWLKDNVENVVVHPKAVQIMPWITWKLDFLVEDKGKSWYVDVKGKETRDFKLKKTLWSLVGILPLDIVKRAPGLPVPWSVERVEAGEYALIKVRRD